LIPNFKFKISNFKSKGFIFLEILIATALISIVFITLLGLAFLSLNISSLIQKTTQADSLVKEELEALRSFRDGTTWSTNGLGAVNTGSGNPYHLILGPVPTEWILVSGTETVDIFSRNIIFDKVSRDTSTNDIENVYNVSNDDPNTRKVTVNIAFNNKTYQVVNYLTNWQNK